MTLSAATPSVARMGRGHGWSVLRRSHPAPQTMVDQFYYNQPTANRRIEKPRFWVNLS